MAIGAKFTGYTVIDGVVATLLGGAALELPDSARKILAMIPFLTSPAGNTATEAVAAEAYMESEDVKVNPFHVLPHPIGSSLLLSVAQLQGDSLKNMYPVNCPVKGGEQIKIYGKGLFDHTIEPYMGALLIYSDQVPVIPQRYSKIGTLTSTGTAAARTTGSNITLIGGRRLKEIFGIAYGSTVAALKGLAGHFDLTSEGFNPPWSLHLPINPASGQVDTNVQEAIAGVSRLQVDIAMKDKSIIADAFTLAVALTTAGSWVVGVAFE